MNEKSLLDLITEAYEKLKNPPKVERIFWLSEKDLQFARDNNWITEKDGKIYCERLGEVRVLKRL